MKIVTIKEVEKRVAERFPNQPFKIITYTKITEPFEIQCLKCNETRRYASCHNFLAKQSGKINLCPCYSQNGAITKHKQNEQIILKLCQDNEDIEFLSFSYREKTRKHCINILCKKCNQVFNKDWESFLNNQTCPYCYSKHNLNTKGFKASLPEEYELLSEYINTETKVLIRHECGFIWNVRPHTFIQKINSGYHGCPQCNHKKSHGEMKISDWLKEHNIIFVSEQIFPWSSNSKFRYDFYLPHYNLIIEYMGAQHYQEVDFFHDTLAERQEHDRVKEKEAREHNLDYLIIPYIEFKNIEQILQDWFNDYSKRK